MVGDGWRCWMVGDGGQEWLRIKMASAKIGFRSRGSEDEPGFRVRRICNAAKTEPAFLPQTWFGIRGRSKLCLVL